MTFFGKRGRERGKKEKAGWFSEVVAREKDGGTFLIFIFFV